MWDAWVWSLVWEDSLEKGTATHCSILACVPRSWTWLSDSHVTSGSCGFVPLLFYFATTQGLPLSRSHFPDQGLNPRLSAVERWVLTTGPVGNSLQVRVVPDSLRPHGLEHPRFPCPSPTPGACSDSCPSSWWFDNNKYTKNFRATFSGPKELSQNTLTQMVQDPKNSFCAWSFQVLTNKSLFVVFKFGIIFLCFYPLPDGEYIPILDWHLKDTYAAHHLEYNQLYILHTLKSICVLLSHGQWFRFSVLTPGIFLLLVIITSLLHSTAFFSSPTVLFLNAFLTWITFASPTSQCNTLIF